MQSMRTNTNRGQHATDPAHGRAWPIVCLMIVAAACTLAAASPHNAHAQDAPAQAGAEAPAIVNEQEPAQAEAEPEAEPEAKPEAKPDNDLAAGIDLSARITYVNIDRRLSFDEQGAVRHESNRLSLSMQCELTAETRPSTYLMTDMEPIKTTGGQTLVPQLDTSPNMIHRGNDNGPISFGVSLSFEEFGQAKGKIQKIAGKVRLQMPTGDMQRARLGPFAEVSNTRATLVGYPGDWLRVRKDDNYTRVEMSRALYDRVADIRFVNGKGRAINGNDRGSSWGGSQVSRSYDLILPGDGVVVVDFYPRLETVDVPFEIKDVPMPQGEKKDVFDMAIVPVPAADDDANPVEAEDEVPTVELKLEGAEG